MRHTLLGQRITSIGIFVASPRQGFRSQRLHRLCAVLQNVVVHDMVILSQRKFCSHGGIDAA